MRRLSVLVLVVVAAGCGGDDSVPPTFEAFKTEWAGCIGSVYGACGETELEEQTAAFVQTIRTLRGDYSDEVLDDQLRDAASYLDGHCPRCVSMLDRERT